VKSFKKFIGIFAIGLLYSSMFTLPYIKYIFYDGLIAATQLTNTQLGLALSAYVVTATIVTPISGYLADRFSVKKQLLASGFAHACLSLLYIFVIQNYLMTIVIWAGMGITSTMLFWSQAFKAVSISGTKEQQGKLYGFFESFNGIGSIIMNFGALYVFSRFVDGVAAVKGVIIFYAAATLVATLLLLILYKPELQAVQDAKEGAEKESKTSTREILQVLKMPRVWILGLIVLGIYGFYVGSSYLTPYFSSVLGVTVVFSGVLATIKNYGTRFVGAPIAGIISDKTSTTKFIFVSYLIMLGLMVAFLMMPASGSALIPVTILMFALALVNVSMKGVMFSMLDEVGVDKKVTGSAVAIVSMIGFTLADLCIHPIFGRILDTFEQAKAYRIIFGTLTALLILGTVCVVIIMLVNKKKKDSNNESQIA
jgi:MFS family permease